MKTIHLIYIPFIFIFSTVDLFAQGEIDNEKKVLFRNEKTYGLSLNSNGWGFGYRYAKVINVRKKWLIEGNINNVKHEKERKEFNYYSTSFSRIAYGKTNLAVNLRFGVGRQYELFEKLDKRSISVRALWIAGASAVFLKPIYYKILEDEELVVKKYEKGIPFFYIWERAPFTKGMSEISVIPGGFVKAGFSFEFSKTNKRVHVLETGLFAELYPKKIEIMANDMNHAFLRGIYFSYRFGKVVSNYHIKETD